MSCWFTFVREGMMYVEFNSVTLFTILYSRFLNCAKDVSKVTAQPTILESVLKPWKQHNCAEEFFFPVVHFACTGI